MHFAEFHIAERLKIYTALLVSSHKRMQIMNYDEVEMMFWQQRSETYLQVYAEYPGRLA